MIEGTIFLNVFSSSWNSPLKPDAVLVTPLSDYFILALLLDPVDDLCKCAF